MVAELVVERAEHAAAIDFVFGGADRDRRAGGAGDVRRTPQTHAAVAVVVARDRQLGVLAQRRLVAERCDGVLAQAGGVIIGIVDRCVVARINLARRRVRNRRAGFTAIVADVRQQHGQVIVGIEVVGAVSEPAEHIERHVLVVLLAAVGIAQPAVDLAFADRDDDLGIDHVLVLRAFALVFVGSAIGIGHKAANAAVAADVQANEAAHRLVATVSGGGIAREARVGIA